MPHPLPNLDIAEQESAYRAVLAQGMADFEAGRTVPFDQVRDWLSSWGTDQELPPPTCG